jgi:hypothetical protein
MEQVKEMLKQGFPMYYIAYAMNTTVKRLKKDYGLVFDKNEGWRFE